VDGRRISIMKDILPSAEANPFLSWMPPKSTKKRRRREQHGTSTHDPFKQEHQSTLIVK